MIQTYTLSPYELDMLRTLRHQTATGPIVDRLVALQLAEWVPSDNRYFHVARLTSAGREIVEEGEE